MGFIDGVVWMADLSDLDGLGNPPKAGIATDRWNRTVHISQEHIDQYLAAVKNGKTPLFWGKQREDGSYSVTSIVEDPGNFNLRDYI